MKPTDGSLDPTLTPEDVSAHGETLADTQAEGRAADRPVASDYRMRELLGRGGMGEVMLAEDTRIGRDVAVKRMRSASPTPEATARFLREAHIQARLDHPAIVPVHELGRDAAGRPFFTMKRLTGTTLAEVLANKRETLQKLLRVVVEVSQAIQFAHARGVIHRDLKPANIMLGEYDEVYVLDWGVARVVGDMETGTSAGIESLDGETQVGAVLGTPGYMSPEQVRGEMITPATDVHALGSILFEVLAAEPVYPKGNAALVATLAGGIEPPSKRTPDRPIAPELDAACADALAFDAADRPTAGELADRIQRYLDGDRDLERRRSLAAEELARARSAVESGDPARRAEAMRAAGRALALDPESDAATLVSQLMLEPPAKLPNELEHRLSEIDRHVVARQSKLAVRVMTTYFVILPLALWMGVHTWWPLVGGFALVGINMFLAAQNARGKHEVAWWSTVFVTVAMLIMFGRMFGPLAFIPTVLVGVSTGLISLPFLLQRPHMVIGGFLAAFYLPLALEALGVWASTWEVSDGRLIITSGIGDVTLAPTITALMLGTTAMLIVAPMFVRTLALMHREARRRIEMQAWHLEQLLPKSR